MLAFLFPGQGSQARGMCAELFDQIEEFRANELTIDSILGWSVREVCLHDPQGQLSQTQFTQPCLYVANALHYYNQLAGGTTPQLVAGHSLGEYNALLAAGVFDFLSGLKLVKRRGELMAQARGGGMCAVLDLQASRIGEVLSQEGLGGIDIANFNSPTQTVIAGPKDELERAAQALQRAGARACVMLPVSAAFHSRYMQPAARDFAASLRDVKFNPPRLPVIANATAMAYPGEDPDGMRALLSRQIGESVRWTDSIVALLAAGATDFKEVGPGTVLTRLTQQIRSTQPVVASPPVPTTPLRAPAITPGSLGSASFKRDYGLKLAYMAGAMYKGIASKELVVAMARGGLMGVLGTGGMSFEDVDAALGFIRAQVGPDRLFGANLLADLARPDHEGALVDLYVRRGVRVVEASAYMQVTPHLVRYRLAGIHEAPDGRIVTPHRIIAKISRPEVAQSFMAPAPKQLLDRLLTEGAITAEQARLAARIPVAQDICVEADSGGHTDQGVAYALMPAMLALRGEMMRTHAYAEGIRIGAAGGIGSPEAAAAAFVLGADFLVTGSINQCTVEAGTSDAVKDMLQDMNVQDTDYAPAGDMFELGARIQVLRKGVFFPARANKLYELYQRHERLEDIDAKTRDQIQQRYFRRSFDDVWAETKAHYERTSPETVAGIEKHPKRKMALIFRWYFIHSTRLALRGEEDQRVDFQVQCGPALGAFNQWVKGTPLENWRNRKVAELGERIMQGAAQVLSERLAALQAPAS